jgi:quercetin dioxygenase-like cupin family protein
VTTQSRSLRDHTETADFLDVMGPLVKPLTTLSKADGDYCLFQSIFPQDVVIPMHSHADRETFYMLSGRIEGWIEGGWQSLGPGNVFDVPENARHAFRNYSGGPASLLLLTTIRLGRFFTEIGRPATAPAVGPPTQAELKHLAARAHDYGYWLGSPEDNLSVGLILD